MLGGHTFFLPNVCTAFADDVMIDDGLSLLAKLGYPRMRNTIISYIKPNSERDMTLPCLMLLRSIQNLVIHCEWLVEPSQLYPESAEVPADKSAKCHFEPVPLQQKDADQRLTKCMCYRRNYLRTADICYRLAFLH